MNNDIFFRPPWTCGKYNAEKHVAIMFNLIEGMDYFFENEAADVVGRVLSVGRYGKISAKKESELCQIEQESIFHFFEKLSSYGLLCSSPITDATISNYRNKCKHDRNIGVNEGKVIAKEEQSSAEDAYCKAVADYNVITSVMFELTYRCNEKCIHCYNPGATRNNNEISTRGSLKELTIDDYKRIVDELCAAGLVVACISGGDPFVYPKTWELIDYLYQKDVAIKIFTNGLKILNDVPKLANYYPRDMRISVYSGIASVHDGITRVKGSLEKTINVIEQLVEDSINVTINCPLMNRNVQSYNTVKEIAKKYNTDVVFDVNILDSIDGDICATRCLRLSPEQLDVILQDTDISGYISKEDPVSLEGNISAASEGVPCEAGVSLFCVKPNGDLIPCNSMHMYLGNLKTQHFNDILETSEPLKKWRTMKQSQFIECWTHDYCAYCDFCIGINYSEHGDPFRAGENNCYIAKCKYELAKKLKANTILNQSLENIHVKDSDLHRRYRVGNKKPLKVSVN